MPDALLTGAIDVALALYPELVAELSYRPIRRERVVALLSQAHRLAREPEIELGALADEFLLFPRELAPRLHDFYAGLCRSAGFEPPATSESSRTRWMLGTWDATTVALLPESVSRDLPEGVVAVPISAPAGSQETQLVWRRDAESPALAAFVELAGTVFAAPAPTAPGGGRRSAGRGVE
jgi:DNA-binding transcriptional LysR family regulator